MRSGKDQRNLNPRNLYCISELWVFLDIPTPNQLDTEILLKNTPNQCHDVQTTPPSFLSSRHAIAPTHISLKYAAENRSNNKTLNHQNNCQRARAFKKQFKTSFLETKHSPTLGNCWCNAIQATGNQKSQREISVPEQMGLLRGGRLHTRAGGWEEVRTEARLIFGTKERERMGWEFDRDRNKRVDEK